jgi:uncharacterized lipoprotein NlpE involved in copper resistance
MNLLKSENLLIFCFLGLALALSACSSNPKRTSVDIVPGVFSGTLPCASCEGIKTTVSFELGGKFTLQQDYLVKDGEQPSKPITGTWKFKRNVIELFADGGNPNGGRLCFKAKNRNTLEIYDMACKPMKEKTRLMREGEK